MLRMTVAEQVGRNIRALRAKRDYSQEDLANITGLARTYISDVERGVRNVSLNTLVTIATALRCQLADLFEDTVLTFAKTKR